MESLFSEIISKIPRKRKRGRPRKYDNPTHRAYLKKRSAQVLGTLIMKKSERDGKLSVRQQHNHIHAERAQNILSKGENGAFLLHYFLHRSTLLAELGRIESKDWLIHAATLIASNQLKGEAARSEIRQVRFGKNGSPRSRWNNFSILRRKIWKSICQFRNLFPGITDEEIIADLKKVLDWLPESLAWAARQREKQKAASVRP